MKQLYETLDAGIEARAGAEFRKDMPLHRAYFHEIAHPARIPALLAEAARLAATPPTSAPRHPSSSAAKLHHGFMQVYPYTENSGRVARLLANLVLLHAGYRLPCIIHATDRQRYYESLRLPEPTLRDLIDRGARQRARQRREVLRETPPRSRKAARSRRARPPGECAPARAS